MALNLHISDQEREDALVEQVEQLLDDTLHYWRDRQSDDTFIYCHMCHEVDGHDNDCPVPHLKKWLETPSPFGKESREVENS